MFSIKILGKKEKRNQEFNKTIKNVINYISTKLNFYDAKIISDNSCIEIISGKEIEADNNEILVELLIRKNIVIKLDDFQDRSKLDEYISEIKHFCEQAKIIEEQKYIPINMR